MRVLLTTAASVFFVNFCECCNSPRCWLKISYSRALKPSIHAVLLLFRRGSGSLANVKCHDRCKVSSSSFSVSLCLTCIESPVHAVPRASVVASKSFALLRPLRFMPDSSDTNQIECRHMYFPLLSNRCRGIAEAATCSQRSSHRCRRLWGGNCAGEQPFARQVARLSPPTP